MYTKPAPRTNQQSLFFDLESQLNQKHPLYLLANKIDWNVFEESFNPNRSLGLISSDKNVVF